MDWLTTLWQTEIFVIDDQNSVQISHLVLAMLFFAIGFVLSKFISRLLAKALSKRQVDPTAIHLLQNIVFYIMLITVMLSSLRLVQIPITMFAFLGGAVVIGLGFGAQNIINNFISGWILMAERPVRIGDLIEVEGQAGIVRSIGARSTHVRRTDGVDMLVPNSAMLENIVVNWTLIDHDIRGQVRVGVQYGSDTQQVVKLIEQAVAGNTKVLKQPAPIVIFEDFGDNALIFDVYFWAQVSTQMQLRIINSDIRLAMDTLFRQTDIVISFPQRDVHLDTLKPLQVKMV